MGNIVMQGIYILLNYNYVPGAKNIGIYDSKDKMIAAIKENKIRPIKRHDKYLGLEIWDMNGQIKSVHTVSIEKDGIKIH